MREAVMETLQTRFLPEFLNRVDEIMIFHPLGPRADSQDRRSAGRPAAEATGREGHSTWK